MAKSDTKFIEGGGKKKNKKSKVVFANQYIDYRRQYIRHGIDKFDIGALSS